MAPAPPWQVLVLSGPRLCTPKQTTVAPLSASSCLPTWPPAPPSIPRQPQVGTEGRQGRAGVGGRHGRGQVREDRARWAPRGQAWAGGLGREGVADSAPPRGGSDSPEHAGGSSALRPSSVRPSYRQGQASGSEHPPVPDAPQCPGEASPHGRSQAFSSNCRDPRVCSAAGMGAPAGDPSLSEPRPEDPLPREQQGCQVTAASDCRGAGQGSVLTATPPACPPTSRRV